MDVRGRLKDLAKAVKKEREIDTRAVERARQYAERIKRMAKTR